MYDAEKRTGAHPAVPSPVGVGSWRSASPVRVRDALEEHLADAASFDLDQARRFKGTFVSTGPLSRHGRDRRGRLRRRQEGGDDNEGGDHDESGQGNHQELRPEGDAPHRPGGSKGKRRRLGRRFLHRDDHAQRHQRHACLARGLRAPERAGVRRPRSPSGHRAQPARSRFRSARPASRTRTAPSPARSGATSASCTRSSAVQRTSTCTRSSIRRVRSAHRSRRLRPPGAPGGTTTGGTTTSSGYQAPTIDGSQ